MVNEPHWNSGLPPVDCPVLVACKDGTVWKVRRTHWLKSHKDNPEYQCATTGHPIDKNDFTGWRYP